MNLSYNWLKQLTNTRQSPEKLAEALNMHVASVEKVEKLGYGPGKVIVAEIIKIKPHPNADKLQLVLVKTMIKNKKVLVEAVCGAHNIQVGQRVPFALPGAKLANGVELESTVIRGVKSKGMLCAEDELGIGSDHTGIYILDDKTRLGQSVSKILGMDDIILEIENKSITHRPDLFNHIGFAREISALTDSSFKFKVLDLKSKSKKSRSLKIRVESGKLCPRYMAVLMDNIKVGPSPKWMQNRLRSLDIRPINNVVDITNYILMEIGQPLHAFDFDKVSQQIVVRKARQGEKLLALDGEKHKLSTDDLVIADSKRPIALAGVMGGELSGISDSTKTIIIESANFDPVCVRRTSWRLGLRTDSALRFEKGLPLNFTELGMFRAIELISKLAGGKVTSQIHDAKSKQTIERLRRPTKIMFDFEKAKKFIGTSVDNKKMVSILKNIGCQVNKSSKKQTVVVTVPVGRPDLTLFEDLVEEVVRIYGADKVDSTPILSELKPVQFESEFILERKIKHILAGCGFDEVYNYSFYSQDMKSDSLSSSRHLQIANPLNPDQQYLRTSLVPGLLKNAEKNTSYFSELKLFEIGNVFIAHEKKKLAGLVRSEQENVYSVIKGVIELVFDKIGINQEKIAYRARKSANTDVFLNKVLLGSFGKVSNTMAVFELDLEKLLGHECEAKVYSPIPAYPPIKRDLAFLVDKNVTWRQVTREVKNIDPLIQEMQLFDIFEDKKFGGKRNLAFHIIYQSFNRTLKSEEVERIQKKIITVLSKKFNAKLRNF